MRNRIALLTILGFISFSGFSQTRVRLNMLEKSPLSNMIVVTKNDSTARYTKLVAGTGLTIAYNEADTTLTLSATASAGNTDEQTLTFDPATGNLSISNGNTVNLTEGIQDAVANMLIAGTNVTLTYDDGAGTLTIAATGTGGGASDLGSLNDVDTTGKANGYVLAYNSATSTWEAQDNTLSIDSTGRVFTVALGNQSVSFEDQVGLTSVRVADLQDVDTTGEATGSVLLYDATSGNWEAQANSIDNLTDGFRGDYSIVLGRSFVKKPTSFDYGTIYIGQNAGPDSTLGLGNIAIGEAVFRSFVGDPVTTGNNNIAIGIEAMNKTLTGFQNLAIGRHALKGNLTGSDNVALGRGAGYNNFGEPDNILTNYNQGLYIGTHATPKDTFSTNEVVIGYNTIGNGSNTATLGNNNIIATYLKGTTNLRGYGVGNKEATDLSKTRSPYIAAFATDGTLLELDTTGLFGGGSGTPQTLTFSESTRELTISDGNTVDLSEGIQEEMNSTLVAGTGITITYDDALNTITVAAPAGSGNTDEQTLSLDNATAVLSISNGNSVDLSEAIDNQVNALLTAGDNISLTYNDGANTLTITSSGSYTNIDKITFNDNTASALSNVLQYNPDYETFVFGMANNTPLHIGQDMGWLVKNQTGNDIPKGTAVMAVGTVGASGRILIDELDATGATSSHYFLGVTAETILNGADGFVISQGKIRGVNTSAFSAGAVLYANPASPGGYTTTEPTGNDLKLPLAFVVNADAVNGEIAVRAFPGSSIHDLHDVDVSTLANNNVLKYNSSLSVWTAQADEVNDADSDPANEIQDLSLSANTLSLSGDATTVDLSSYLDDQTVSLTGAGITAISGTYPNFTITSTELDGSTTNELQNLSIASNILSLSNSVATVDLSGYLDNTDAQSISLASNTLSISGNASTVDLSGYLDDQTVSLTGGGITAISGTYPNFTITSTEVDGSTTNEIQDLSLSGTTLSLTGDATTVDLSGFLQNTLSSAVTITGNTNNYIYNAINDFQVNLAGAKTLYMGHAKMYMSMDATELKLFASEQPVTIDAAIGLKLNGYGAGNKEAGDLSKTASAYIAGLATDGTVIDVTASSLQATASNGLTKTGSNIELGGTLTKATQINLPANGSLIMGDLTNAPATALAVLDANNTVVTYGTAVLADYGSNNKEASDLSVTPSNYKAAFATDGTLIEVSNIDAMVIACSDETTDITTGTKVTFRAPFAMTITGVRASLATASSSGTPTVDINEGGVSILGTTLSIDANERTSTTAASAATITDTAIADDAEITIDIDAAGTGAKGLKVTILYRK